MTQTPENDAADPMCVCGENLMQHRSEHSFVDAEHYFAASVIPPGAGRDGQ